jgi:hypothetical protein
MKVSDFLSGLVYLFNDVIGAIVPGLFLLGGLHLLGLLPSQIVETYRGLSTEGQWVTILVLGYVAGHGLLGFHRPLQRVLVAPIKGLDGLLTRGTWDARDLHSRILAGLAYRQFRDYVAKEYPRKGKQGQVIGADVNSFNELRNIAMTMSVEAATLGRRFMFISLFCYGVAMAILTLLLAYLFVEWASLTRLQIANALLTSVVIYLFYTRGLEFELRALSVPFSTALAEMLIEKRTKKRGK